MLPNPSVNRKRAPTASLQRGRCENVPKKCPAGGRGKSKNPKYRLFQPNGFASRVSMLFALVPSEGTPFAQCPGLSNPVPCGRLTVKNLFDCRNFRSELQRVGAERIFTEKFLQQCNRPAPGQVHIHSRWIARVHGAPPSAAFSYHSAYHDSGRQRPRKGGGGPFGASRNGLSVPCPARNSAARQPLSSSDRRGRCRGDR